MKIVEKGIYELLKGLAGGRVYALRAPQNATAPFIVYQRLGSERWRSFNAPSGIAQADIQIDVYATDIYTSKDIGADIEGILDGYAGSVIISSDSPPDAVVIGGVTLQGDVDFIDETDEPFLFRNSARYTVTYEQE